MYPASGFPAPLAALWVGVVLCSGSPAQVAGLPPAAPQPVDFARDIKPIFEAHCRVCHGEAAQQSGLRLDLGSAAMKGGYSGPVIVPHNSAESRLILMVAGAIKDVVMPPAGEPLTLEQIGLLRGWIDQGAAWPENAPAGVVDSSTEPLAHWAYRPLVRPTIPRIASERRVNNPIDAFVLARLEQDGIRPSPGADKATLLRRVCLDLTGLPPTPEQIEAFLGDDGPRAYEKVVDAMLESEHYGEKWAMHWLDLARYADSDGYEKDLVRPHAWRYRHWVIRALNDDIPFDQFTIEQIAGDLLPNATTEQKVATGFHRNTLKNREGGVNIEQFRFEEVVDRASTVGTVWLGLTLGCAQCHDHKFDPITQKDYYGMFAFFNNADEVNINAPLPGEIGPYRARLPRYRRERETLLRANRVYELMSQWEGKMRKAARNPGFWTNWDHAYDALGKYLDHGQQILEKDPAERNQREVDELTDHFVKNYHRVISKEFWKELDYERVFKHLKKLEREFPSISRAQTIAESGENRKSHVHIRGSWRETGIEVEPATPAFLGKTANAGQATRLDLAAWLVSRDNPLTPRVTVNRIWQEYFGAGLVRTSENFGSQGEPPSHPELLDWLAADFVDGGWSLKRLHKLIVLSATYRQSSASRPGIDAHDPDNRLLSRQNRLRLPAELIRDAALSASGLLYPKIGGESVRPPIPDGVIDLSYGSSVDWPESIGKARYRRGLYVLLQRTVPYPQMANFDATAREVTLCIRERSNTPLQALNMLNDPVFMEAARAMAIRILTESAGDFHDRLRYAFRLALARSPDEAEVSSLTDYYRRQTRILENEPGEANKLAPVRIEGASPIETASWTGLSSVLLNLDEFITRE